MNAIFYVGFLYHLTPNAKPLSLLNSWIEDFNNLRVTVSTMVGYLGHDAFSMNLTTELHLFLPCHYFPLRPKRSLSHRQLGEQTGHWVIHPSIHSCLHDRNGPWEDSSARPAVSIVTAEIGHEEMPMCRFFLFFFPYSPTSTLKYLLNAMLVFSLAAVVIFCHFGQNDLMDLARHKKHWKSLNELC